MKGFVFQPLFYSNDKNLNKSFLGNIVIFHKSFINHYTANHVFCVGYSAIYYLKNNKKKSYSVDTAFIMRFLIIFSFVFFSIMIIFDKLARQLCIIFETHLLMVV